MSASIHDPSAERALIGCALLAPDATDRAGQIIASTSVDDFWLESHRAIWRAIVETWTEHRLVDSVAILAQLRASGEMEAAGGGAYLSRLGAAASTSVNWELYAGKLKDARRRRDLAGVAAAIAGAGEDADPFELAEAAISTLAEISADAPAQTLPKWRDLGSPFVDWMEDNSRRFRHIGRSPQWTLGWPGIDEALPLHPGRSMILGGASGSGKTGLALQALIATALEYGEAGLFISLEMTANLSYLRAMSRRIPISETDLMVGSITGETTDKITRFLAEAGDVPLYIDDSCPADVVSIDRRIRAAAKAGVKWVAIDYLQLINYPGRKFDRLSLEFGAIMYRLHRTAQKVGVGLCMLAQLRKSLDGVVPTKDDIKDGGDSVMAADLVALIHRPGDLPEEERERRSKGQDGPVHDDAIRIYQSKNRYGSPTGGRFGWSFGRVVPVGEDWPSWARALDSRNVGSKKDN